MSSGSVRRTQLIAPFGVGALSVVPNGTSVVTAGLDYWFQRDEGGNDSQSIDLDEFRLEEWRLQAELRVNHFRLPPDWRTRWRHGREVPNLKLPVPFQRFPAWNFCPRCYRLEPVPLSSRGRVRCTDPSHDKGRTPYMAQVPFVAICDYGHMQDFPWREWVHRSTSPTCSQPLRLRSTGGASLSAQTVECGCGRSRNLAGITEAEPAGSPRYPRTTLSAELADSDDEYLCQGGMPWHGEEAGRECARPVRGSLRAASNLYYALTKSSIYLPRASSSVPEALIEALSKPPLSTFIAQLSQAGSASTLGPDLLRSVQREVLQPFTDPQVDEALAIITSTTNRESQTDTSGPVDSNEDEFGNEVEFRRPEFEVLRHEIRTPYLEIRSGDLAAYDPWIRPYLSRLMLIDKLRETRALYGFTRIYPESQFSLHDRKSMLWKRQPDPHTSWLPAYVVHGEGLYLELDEARLSDWEQRSDVQRRVTRLASNYALIQRNRDLRQRDLSPRFLLLHTLAHLVINQLTFECGYSSASLRERLYVSGGHSPMAGLLIYTAAGDAEGTMGGLVRMGRPRNFEPTLDNALDNARWCSADPVCMELGEAGQGPDSCNMAACHNCALVPETACEEFNRFLDRGLVVGTHERPELGFFDRS